MPCRKRRRVNRFFLFYQPLNQLPEVFCFGQFCFFITGYIALKASVFLNLRRHFYVSKVQIFIVCAAE
ncbi:hypothetical protein BVG80_12805 [Sphingobacteriales bacterium TSM_CSM]|nr:hypothetical protein BVG80_12805 [Sphingobacteriales bacterium TSM_CSM]